MPLHHTNDLGTRALDIADREAGPIWQKTRDFSRWASARATTEQEVLRELQPEQDLEFKEYPDCPCCGVNDSVASSHIGNTFYCYECDNTFD